MTGDETTVLAGRSCAGCNLCCKIPKIDELQKAAGAWCKHCDIGRGCRIHGAHPDQCREFLCGYLTWNLLGQHWRPADIKMLVMSKSGGAQIAVHVDMGAPNAWKTKPFYSEIKQWSRIAASQRRPGGTATQILVLIGKRVFVILPDRDVDLGVVADDERIFVNERMTPRGVQVEALKLKKDDPRLSGAASRHAFGSGVQPNARPGA